MEEAVGICKLRLFLKLAAQVEPDSTKDNLGIERCRHRFNISCQENTLVAEATYDEVKRAVTSTLDFDNAIGNDRRQACRPPADFDKFRQLQTKATVQFPPPTSWKLQKRLNALEDELNPPPRTGNTPSRYTRTRRLTQVGEVPPAVSIGSSSFTASSIAAALMPSSAIRRMSKRVKVNEYRITNYKTIDSGNLYALCLERSGALLATTGYMGVIVPLSGFSTERMLSYQEFLWNRFNSLALRFTVATPIPRFFSTA